MRADFVSRTWVFTRCERVCLRFGIAVPGWRGEKGAYRNRVHGNVETRT